MAEDVDVEEDVEEHPSDGDDDDDDDVDVDDAPAIAPSRVRMPHTENSGTNDSTTVERDDAMMTRAQTAIIRFSIYTRERERERVEGSGRACRKPSSRT
jgi:hypothetical protein